MTTTDDDDDDFLGTFAEPASEGDRQTACVATDITMHTQRHLRVMRQDRQRYVHTFLDELDSQIRGQVTDEAQTLFTIASELPALKTSSHHEEKIVYLEQMGDQITTIIEESSWTIKCGSSTLLSLNNAVAVIKYFLFLNSLPPAERDIARQIKIDISKTNLYELSDIIQQRLQTAPPHSARQSRPSQANGRQNIYTGRHCPSPPQHQGRQNTHRGRHNPSPPQHQGRSSSRDPSLKCFHCRREGHGTDQCWFLHGRPNKYCKYHKNMTHDSSECRVLRQRSGNSHT